MRILDIDLDFFLDHIPSIPAERAKSGIRLENNQYHLWDGKAVRNFLEDKCGLTNDKKIKGKILTRHNEVFNFWREIYKVYRAPFEVVHIDAHSDLGHDGSWLFVMGTLLSKSPKEREYPEKWIPGSLCPELCGITEGNYLIFAAACRWINKLTFITHPKWRQEQHDFEPIHFKNCDCKSGYLQLKRYDHRILKEDLLSHDNIVYNNKYDPLELEPEIEFNIIQCSDFKDSEGFMFMNLSCSPEFTPDSADELIPIFKEYIEEI